MAEIYTATLTDARILGPHVRELTLSPPEAVEAGAEPFPQPLPGQWLSLRLPVGDRPPLVRAYSLAGVPIRGNLTICFDRVANGSGSSYLWDAPLGTQIEFSGPLGNFTLPNTDQDLVLLARFTGIVPFRAMLQALDADPVFYTSRRRVYLLHEADTLEDLIYQPWIAAMAMRTPWLSYIPMLPRKSSPPLSGIGSFVELLEALQVNAERWMPFVPMVCGVREFTFPVRAYLMEHLGFERKAVRVENYNGPSGR